MSATPEEKKKRLHKDFDIAMTEEFESEVRDMCNLSRALVDQGHFFFFNSLFHSLFNSLVYKSST